MVDLPARRTVAVRVISAPLGAGLTQVMFAWMVPIVSEPQHLTVVRAKSVSAAANMA